MKLIIEIPDKMYKTVQDGTYCGSLYEKLKNGIPVEQCVECIKRQDVEDAIYDYSRSCDVNYAQIMEFIDKLPSVTAQPKMGHWIFDEILDKHYYCSECKSMGVDYWDFCPNCGAKMQEVEE